MTRAERFSALEASRLSRGAPDLTRAASAPRASAPFAYKGVVVHRHDGRAKLVSDDGLRFEYAGTSSAERHGPKLRGLANWSPEKRRAVSRMANAARWAK